MTVNQLYQALSARIPSALSESWDNDGMMLCPNREKIIEHALVMLDVTPEGIEKAVSETYDVIITHHPLIFHPIKSLTDDFARMVRTLLVNNIPVLSFHTRLDAMPNFGVNDCLANAIGLQNISPFGGESGTFGRVGMLEKDMAKAEFLTLLKDKLLCTGIRFSANSREKIRKVAVVGGAGKSFLQDALRVGADAFVTSEISHDVYYDGEKSGILLCDCGHFYTENVVCQSLASLVEQASDGKIHVEIFGGNAPYAEL